MVHHTRQTPLMPIIRHDQDIKKAVKTVADLISNKLNNNQPTQSSISKHILETVRESRVLTKESTSPTIKPITRLEQTNEIASMPTLLKMP